MWIKLTGAYTRRTILIHTSDIKCVEGVAQYKTTIIFKDGAKITVTESPEEIEELICRS